MKNEMKKESRQSKDEILNERERERERERENKENN